MSQEVKSKLEMLDLYFSAYSFKRNKKQEINSANSIETTFKINYAEKKDDRNQVKIEIETIVKDKNECFELNLSTVAFFRLDRDKIDEKVAEFVLKKNTVAIMMPYIRCQVSLLTTQPGMNPVLLQPIDINALVDKTKD